MMEGLDLREDAVRMTVYFGERDRWEGKPLANALVELLRARGLWGCTVTRGLLGFGKRSVLHAALPLRLSEDLPLVLECIDAERKVQAVLPEVERRVKDGLITLESVKVVRHVGQP
jgi:PII-like signaling protein